MKIALDAMGGDNAPKAIVEGAIAAAGLMEHEILLVGIPAEISRHLPVSCPKNVHIHPASEVVDMHEKPTEALRLKKDSSISVSVNLVKEGGAHAFVSAGNTGACTAACLLGWRQIHGFHRPAIGSTLPSLKEDFLLLDAGASPDVDPEHLVEFALMGRSFVMSMWGRENPTVHLLNIGEEPGKGNAFAKQAHALLATHDWFRGNIEGKDMYHGGIDIVVCDAFVGNIVLKCAEGVAEMIVEMIRSAVPTNPIAKLPYLPLKSLMAPLRKKMDYAEIGGSPLLGLNGLGFMAHGRSNAKAIRNALLQAAKAMEADLVGVLRESIAKELE